MRHLVRLFDIITADTLTLTASGLLVVAVLAILILMAWPSREARAGTAARGTRAAEAHNLAAAGTPLVEIARRTGLSRDALALMTGAATATARQKGPDTARLSPSQRPRRGAAPGQRPAKVTA